MEAHEKIIQEMASRSGLSVASVEPIYWHACRKLNSRKNESVNVIGVGKFWLAQAKSLIEVERWDAGKKLLNITMTIERDQLIPLPNVYSAETDGFSMEEVEMKIRVGGVDHDVKRFYERPDPRLKNIFDISYEQGWRTLRDEYTGMEVVVREKQMFDENDVPYYYLEYEKETWYKQSAMNWMRGLSKKNDWGASSINIIKNYDYSESFRRSETYARFYFDLTADHPGDISAWAEADTPPLPMVTGKIELYPYAPFTSQSLIVQVRQWRQRFTPCKTIRATA